MKSGVEVNSGALLRVFHGVMVALRRQSVNLAATVGMRSNDQNQPRGSLRRLHSLVRSRLLKTLGQPDLDD